MCYSLYSVKLCPVLRVSYAAFVVTSMDDIVCDVDNTSTTVLQQTIHGPGTNGFGIVVWLAPWILHFLELLSSPGGINRSNGHIGTLASELARKHDLRYHCPVTALHVSFITTAISRKTLKAETGCTYW